MVDLRPNVIALPQRREPNRRSDSNTILQMLFNNKRLALETEQAANLKEYRAAKLIQEEEIEKDRIAALDAHNERMFTLSQERNKLALATKEITEAEANKEAEFIKFRTSKLEGDTDRAIETLGLLNDLKKLKVEYNRMAAKNNADTLKVTTAEIERIKANYKPGFDFYVKNGVLFAGQEQEYLGALIQAAQGKDRQLNLLLGRKTGIDSIGDAVEGEKLRSVAEIEAEEKAGIIAAKEKKLKELQDKEAKLQEKDETVSLSKAKQRIKGTMERELDPMTPSDLFQLSDSPQQLGSTKGDIIDEDLTITGKPREGLSSLRSPNPITILGAGPEQPPAGTGQGIETFGGLVKALKDNRITALAAFLKAEKLKRRSKNLTAAQKTNLEILSKLFKEREAEL
jgi:hypothetical protein